MTSLRPSPQAAALELLRRRKARAGLIDYARYIEVPGAPVSDREDEDEFQPVETVLAAHHEIILSATQRCIERHSGRTMLFLPPGSAKSTYATVVAPTWAMGRKPGFKVIAVSYGSDLAKKFGRRMRSIVRQPAFSQLFGTRLSAESSAADEWALENGSEFMGGGILSGITGNRADFCAIDDPIKGRQDADSEAVRKSTLDAYQEDVLTRLKPGGSLMLTQTRWHEGDLAGEILPAGWAGESGMIECRDGNTWEVICIPAKCERADDPLGRKIGEYIWPEWFPADHWKTFERLPRTWSALYQQRPSPDTGDYFKREWIHTVDSLPPRDQMMIYGGSDYAVTAQGGDFTVHVVVGIDPDGRMYLLDLWRDQASSDVWVEAFCDLVKKWKPIGWAEETGQIKSGVGPFLEKRAMERDAFVAREAFATRGDKAIRAQSIRGRMAMSGLYVHRAAPFLSDLISEMMSFPVGVHDDQCVAEGTLISMADGSRKPIERVAVGDLVKTPIGACKVEASCITNESAAVYRINLVGGHELIATGNHPVYVENKGFVRVDELSMMDQIRLEPSCSAERQRPKLSNIWGIATGAIPTARVGPINGISTRPSRGAASFTGICGKTLTALSRKAMTFITSMATGVTTRSKISSVYRKRSIGDGIRLLARLWTDRRSTLNAFEGSPQIGTPVMQAALGTQCTASPRGQIGRPFGSNAQLAASNSTQRLIAPNSARARASSEALEAVAGSVAGLFAKARRSLASVATETSSANGLMTPNTAQRHAGCVIGIEALSEKVRVRNLTVKNAHTFYANGLLTHNCDALGLVGQLMDRMLSGEKPKTPDRPAANDYVPYAASSDANDWMTY